jgi:hypothetical protein
VQQIEATSKHREGVMHKTLVCAGAGGEGHGHGGIQERVWDREVEVEVQEEEWGQEWIDNVVIALHFASYSCQRQQSSGSEKKIRCVAYPCEPNTSLAHTDPVSA